MILIDNLSIRTRHGARLLETISVGFETGKVHAIVGPNGSGKTTLLRAICRLISPTSGTISIDHRNIADSSQFDLASRISWTESEHMSPFAYSVEDTILWGRWPQHQGLPSFIDRKHMREAAECVGVAEMLNRPITNLSLGERKKTHLAKSLASGATYLIWDEPCAPLDIRASLNVLEIAKSRSKLGQTIILSIHDITMAERYADSITILKQGQLVWNGNPKDEPCIPHLEATFDVKINRSGQTLRFDPR
jgi:iron complex transport system ATP-binding protein